MGISGHRGLPPDTVRLVDQALRTEVARRTDGGLVGYSCIADGADALFAEAVLQAGGDLVVVVPAAKYREGLPVEHHPVYDRLMASAGEVIQLDHVESTSEAHQDGSVRLLKEVDELLAVWDGLPARGYGGTADVVAAAREHGVPVTVVWPEGATRGQ
ncbi:hypothetical protein FNH05_14130 [Amycolatopsis rhizosphaerae]|uniref:DUF1273 family protein n=1 Tax=Amycolatopsis rhizosphaerae TaxID=2053003 RepID=A0A558CSX0_9PSEU|nr:hypothetical protein FNH05_14130 [Amycolatopsis rhizosphaerae]